MHEIDIPNNNFMEIAFVARACTIFTSHKLFYAELLLMSLDSILTREDLGVASLVVPGILLLIAVLCKAFNMKGRDKLVVGLLGVVSMAKLIHFGLPASGHLFKGLGSTMVIILLHVLHKLLILHRCTSPPPSPSLLSPLMVTAQNFTARILQHHEVLHTYLSVETSREMTGSYKLDHHSC